MMKMRIANVMLFGVLFLLGLWGAGNVWAELPASGNVVFWLKADTGVQKDANNKVSGWQDQSGKSNNAVQANADSQPVWMAAAAGGKPAVLFSSTAGTCMTVPDSASLNITNAITIAAWVNMYGWNNYPGIVAKGYGELVKGGYSIHVRDNSSIWFELDETNGTRHYYNAQENTLTMNNWCHVVATYDGSIQRVYINGRQVGPGLPGTFTIGTISDNVMIGNLPGGYGCFDGLIDDVVIWNHALSDSEIATLYKSTLISTPAAK